MSWCYTGYKFPGWPYTYNTSLYGRLCSNLDLISRVAPYGSESRSFWPLLEATSVVRPGHIFTKFCCQALKLKYIYYRVVYCYKKIKPLRYSPLTYYWPLPAIECRSIWKLSQEGLDLICSDQFALRVGWHKHLRVFGTVTTQSTMECTSLISGMATNNWLKGLSLTAGALVRGWTQLVSSR
jgi:hypothetical protein